MGVNRDKNRMHRICVDGQIINLSVLSREEIAILKKRLEYKIIGVRQRKGRIGHKVVQGYGTRETHEEYYRLIDAEQELKMNLVALDAAQMGKEKTLSFPQHFVNAARELLPFELYREIEVAALTKLHKAQDGES